MSSLPDATAMVSRSQSMPAIALRSPTSPRSSSQGSNRQHSFYRSGKRKQRKRKRFMSPHLHLRTTPSSQMADQEVPQSANSEAASPGADPGSPIPDLGTTISFWDYLRDELTVSDFDSAQELKRERVTNFLAVPGSVEKLMIFGFVVCLDSFLYTFTILPLRFCLAFYQFSQCLSTNIRALFAHEKRFVRLRPSQKCDLLKGFLIIITCLLMSYIDPSRLYHSIRGQAVLKLYIVFNVLEICDKLCCSVGVDILDALFSKSTLGRPEQVIGGAAYAKRQLRPLTLFFLATGYMAIHTTVLFFEMITLNVAINFYSNALLSLLISNQFVEIKQSVFKKFERENLFQLSCSDIVERFQQAAFLMIITLRNVVEMSESPPSSVLPSTFVPLFFNLPITTWLNALMTPVVMVIASELMVDWLKHAFITKFNQIRPSIYGKYIDILCKDLVIGSPGRLTGKRHAFIDQSPVVSRRIGFPHLPLACLHVRMSQILIPMIFWSNHQGDSSTVYVASTITNGLLNYLSDSQGLVGRLLPARIQLVLLSLVKCEWLEQGLEKGFRIVLWTIIISAMAIILLALKAVVGTTLLGYAYKRYASMEARDAKENEKDKIDKELGKDMEEYREGLRTYLNDPTDHVLGQQPIRYTLDNVDRFSMVRSRIP